LFLLQVLKGRALPGTLKYRTDDLLLMQASKIAAGFIAALLLLLIFWSRKIFTIFMSLLFVAIIIACYFIPQPVGGEIIRYFVLFIG
jgi:hypothetical protein